MKVTKEMVEKASKAYAEKRHPSRWDGEPWGDAGRRNHAAAIKNALHTVLADYDLTEAQNRLLTYLRDQLGDENDGWVLPSTIPFTYHDRTMSALVSAGRVRCENRCEYKAITQEKADEN